MEIIDKLRDKQRYYHTGGTQEVLYKVVNWSHCFVESANYVPGAYEAVNQWLDECDKQCIDTIDAFIAVILTEGYLGTIRMSVFFDYPEAFVKAIKYFVDDYEWEPPSEVAETSKEVALCYTRVHLEHLYKTKLT